MLVYICKYRDHNSIIAIISQILNYKLLHLKFLSVTQFIKLIVII